MSADYAIVGAGVAGLCVASELAKRGVACDIYERASGLGASSCSWFAGGMLAPYCEGESSEALVTEIGAQAIDWWQNMGASLEATGTLVVASARDLPDLKRFAALTERHSKLDAAQIDQLEPELAGRFSDALYFKDEASLDPRGAMVALLRYCQAQGCAVEFDSPQSPQDLLSKGYRGVIDCRGMAAAEQCPGLRGVKGEMMLINSASLRLNRTIRLLHPRIPLYVVPRGDGLYMLGATMIESEDRRFTVRSGLELLNSLYALHPGFATAEILEMAADLRPAFDDHLPRIIRQAAVWRVNGLYRHGFLLAPALAQQVADGLIDHQFHGVFYAD